MIKSDGTNADGATDGAKTEQLTEQMTEQLTEQKTCVRRIKSLSLNILKMVN